MDPVDLLPGLVEVTEERLGRPWGRRVTTSFTVAVLLGAGAWFLKLFFDNAVKPVVGVFYVESVSVNLVEILTVYGMGALLVVAVTITTYRITLAKLQRKHDALLGVRPRNNVLSDIRH